MTTPLLPLEAAARAICTAQGLTFVRHVGDGAFKTTFHVHLADGTPQALKVYRANNTPERVAREIDAMKRCAHPHIGRFTLVATHQDVTGQYAYSLEEFLPGGTLADRLAAGPMSAAEVQALGTALIDAVGHIAGLELVHRDLKPENVLFREDGTAPVVTDFGLVRDLAARSITQTFLMQGPGTPLYASAEQLNNDKAIIGWRADQFSLGVLLSYCAFGSHPYAEPGDEPMDAITRVVQRAGPSTTFVEAAEIAGLPTLIRMVAPWPVQRFRTFALLAAAWAGQGAAGAVPNEETR